MAKQLMFDDAARAQLKEGLSQLTEAVKVTLGPTGKNVILHKSWGSPKITKDGVTSEQKSTLIAGVTDLLVKVLGKNPATTVVVIEEIDTDNWGIGGESVTKRRQGEA